MCTTLFNIEIIEFETVGMEFEMNMMHMMNMMNMNGRTYCYLNILC